MARYLDDLKPGDAFESPRHTVTQDAIVAFARRFDPQPFHTDPAAASAAFFGTLIGSGWHTAALTMRMLTESQMDIAHGLIGAGVEKLRWPTPLLPGDVLRVRIEVLDVRASSSRPEIGIVRIRVRTLRDDDSLAQEMIASIVVPVKPTAG